MTDALPEGHPLAWEDLAAYERDQGGYWLYPTGCDVYGNGRVWVRVPRPERPGEMIGFRNRLSRLVQDIETRAADTGNAEMAALAAQLKQVSVDVPGPSVT
jgi:hypothetical protein